MKNSHNLTRAWLLTGTVLTTLAFSFPVMAQDTTATTPPADDTTPAAPPVAEEETTEIVVTGSRIRRSEFNSPSPIQVITSEKSLLSGMVSATEVLQSSSVAAGSGQINNTFTGYVVNGGDGINTVSLRGLGSQRTLVLLNGHRLPPSGVGGTVAPVDLNTIPESMVSRFEILKDGASSIYGSDAVAGVVNVITRKNVDGLELSTTLKKSEHGGGDEYEYNAVWGKTFDRGDLLISGSSYEKTELTQGDREAFRCPMDNYYLNGQQADFIDPKTGTFKCYGGATNGYVGTYYPHDYWQLLSDYGYSNYLGSRAITPGTTTNGVDGWAFIPYQNRDFNNKRLESQTVISPVKNLSFFAQGNYRPAWADGIELYGELMLNQRKSEQTGWRTFFPFFHDQSAANPFSVGSDPFFGLGLGAEPYLLTPANSSQKVDVYRVLGGARGDVGTWKWDAYLSHSSSKGIYKSIAIPQDRVSAGTGTDQLTKELMADGVCGPSAPAGCVPLNVFTQDVLENGNYPKALADYYFVPETGKTTYDQTIVEATITGDLYQLPAGAISAAFGVSMRRDKINDVPGEFSRNHNVWGFTTAGVTAGEDTVKEIYGEFEIPVLKGKPFFEDLTVDISGRYSDYDSVGSATTYKVGVDWAVDNILRLRATSGTSFRAPGLFELFLADQTSFLSQSQVDPCINYGLLDEDGNPVQTNATIRTNCAADGLPANWVGAGASAEITIGGGSELDPETSTATSFGFVLTPPETGFKFAMDFWRISVEDQIASTIGGVYQCYASEFFRSRPGFCDTFTRGTDGSVATVDASYRNIPTQQTAGIDFTTDYTKEFNFGTLNISSQITYTDYDRYQSFPGEPKDDYNGIISDPKWVGDVQTQFKHQDWTVTWTVHYAQASSNFGFFGEDGTRIGLAPTAGDYTYRVSVPDFYTHDLSVRYQAKTWRVVVGLTNLMDNTPPYIGNGNASGSAQRLGNYPAGSQYYAGYVGRSGFVNLSKTF